MTKSDFIKEEGKELWKATLDQNSCVLQLRLKRLGAVSINVSVGGMESVVVDHYKGDNMLRKIDIPDGCVVTVVTSAEVEDVMTIDS